MQFTGNSVATTLTKILKIWQHFQNNCFVTLIYIVSRRFYFDFIHFGDTFALILKIPLEIRNHVW